MGIGEWRAGSRWRRAGALLVFSAVVFPDATRVLADDWRAFLPRPVENGAFLESFLSYERDDRRSGSRTRWQDLFVREKVTVYSIGYSYHPRFVQYRFSIAGSAKQEDYGISGREDPGWKYDSGFEYDTQLDFLPEHRYNLEAYARRFEPVFKEQAATQHDNLEETRGASFRLRNKPYFFHAGYGNDSIETGGSSSEIHHVETDAEYFKRFAGGNELSFTGAYSPRWYGNSEGVDGMAVEYHAGNLVDLQRVRLDSNFTRDTFDQTGSAQDYETDQLSWYELVTARLPLGFRGDASYRQQNNDAAIESAGSTRRLSTDGRDVELDLVHRLYQSVDTTYTFLQNWRDSSGGDTTSQLNSVSVDYTKTIPWESRVLAGVRLARNDTESQGRGADIVNESYPAVAVPGSFTLRQQNVDADSIEVFLRSPLPPFDIIALVEDVHYIVVPVLSTFEIRIVSLPPELVVPGTYDFLTSYSLLAGDFELRSETVGASASVELFRNLFTPYFSYVEVRSKVLSGTFPGNPLDSTTYTSGLIFRYDGVRLRGEYQELHWEVSPFESWRAEAQYSAALGAHTSAYGSASYLYRHYGRGTGQLYASSFDEQTETVFASVRRELVRNMFVAVGGSYTHLTGLVDGDAYSANASWVWTIGKAELTLGANAYGSKAEGSGSVSTEREHELVYFRFRRRLL